jgi:2-methylcitrate dehydratase PrpD
MIASNYCRMNTSTRTIAQFACDTDFATLPAELIDETKYLVLDHAGCAVAGSSVAKGTIAVELARQLGGTPQATILGQAGKVSSANAAFANGELMNALDWDAIPHTLPCVIAPCLALAEQCKASGRDLILAIQIGYEIASRLAEVLPGDLEEQPHGYGSCVLGAVAGAGRILGLTQEQMENALGIAGFAAPVPAMTRFEGGASPIPMTKYISIGWVAQTAVISALLAGLGYTGDRTILDGREGFWRLFGGTPEKWDAKRLTDGLGSEWRAGKPWYKPYPCEVLIGVAINRLRDIMREHALGPDDIEAIEFRSIPVLATPCHTTTQLTTHVDAQFSVPYALAVAANGNEPGPAWQDEQTMRNPGIARFMEKVTVGIQTQSELAKQASSVGHIPLHLEVVANGQRHTIDRVETVLSRDQLETKFANNAATRLPADQVNAARRLILGLDQLEDVSQMTESLAPDGEN